MRVLLTGAGGFVGGHLALGLAKLGFSLLLNDRAFGDEAARLPDTARLTCDVLELGAHLGAHLAATGAPAPDALIHAAAVTADPAERGLSAADALQEDITGTLEMLALAQRLGVKRFILLSSAGVFTAAAPAPLDETAPPDALGGYATAKRVGELAALSLRHAGAVDAVTVRLGNLYGPFEAPRPTRPRVSLVGRTAQEARATGRISVAQPEAAREWTFAPDLAPAFARLLTHPAPPDTLHLCAPEVLTDAELAGRLGALLPGTRVERRPTGEPVRPPLTSRFPELHPAWTPLAVGLPLALGLAEVPA